MPTSGQYNLISLDTIYLTSDGTETGIPCKVEFPNGDQLRGSLEGATILSANKTPYTFVIPKLKKGVYLPMKILQLMGTQVDDLEELFDTKTLAGETISMVVEGDTGDYALEVTGYYAEGIRPIQFSGKFNRDRIYDVTLNVVVAGET